jgi:hypothetical protein
MPVEKHLSLHKVRFFYSVIVLHCSRDRAAPASYTCIRLCYHRRNTRVRPVDPSRRFEFVIHVRHIIRHHTICAHIGFIRAR